MMDKLLQDLSSFDPAARRAALAALARQPAPAGPATDWVNMHMHSFFSFNGEGFAPERLAWEARRAGLYAAAVCDFDVLEGAASFLAAAASLGLRAAAGFESRVFFTEYASREINSPGEPGVFYFMGMGFVRPPAPETAAGKVLARMLALSHERNRAAIARVNAALGDPCLDYERDVLPLTPAGNATERHIVRSYYELALRARGGLEPALRWWAAKFNLDPAGLLQNAGDINKTLEVLRAKLFKQGGIGYVQPTPQMFPVLDEVIGMIRQCGAIPMSA